MFVLEAYLRKRRNTVRAWEDAGRRWVNKQNGYYTMRDWAQKNPYPVVNWRQVAKIAIPSILAIVIGVVGALWIATGDHPQKQNHHNTSQVQKGESRLEVGDTAQVVYGDYKDSVGVVVKSKDNGYIIKLTNSTNTHAMCDASDSCNSGGGTENGQLLNIGSNDNLVPAKATK